MPAGFEISGIGGYPKCIVDYLPLYRQSLMLERETGLEISRKRPTLPPPSQARPVGAPNRD